MKKMTRVERKKRRKRMFFRLLLLILLVAIVLIFAFNSELFLIDYIMVEGNNKLDYDFIVNTSLIDVGENIFRVKTSNSEDLLKNNPYIKNVTVKRKLPNTIKISLEERQVTHQFKILSSFILLDNEGYVLEISNEQINDIPTFTGFELIDVNLGESIFADENNSSIHDFFFDDQVYKTISQMSLVNYVENDKNINIDLNSGIVVAFGPLDNVKYKIRLLEKILLDIEKKQIKCKMIIMNNGKNPILVTDN